MGKEKRKGRLDKSLGTAHSEFIGFSSFADSGSASETTSVSSPATNSSWSPIYTGSDENLQILFPRISQKRDATTKVKALQQLETFLSSTPGDPSIGYNDDRVLRRQQVEAIQHFAWLYYNKLHFDASPIVRAAALDVWLAAHSRIPKAVSQLVTTVQPELLGMIYTTSQADRGIQVKASERIKQLFDSESEWPWEYGLVELYVSRMLSFGRSSTMYEALFAKKNSKADGQSSKDITELPESHKDMAEEQFERIVGTCLDALRLWLLSRSERNAQLNTSIWWKTLTSGMPALRLKTLQLLMVCCQKRISIPSTTTSMLIQELSSERQVTNVAAVLNALVAYIAYIHQSECSNKVVDMESFVKPLTKVLKKGCYGAPANDWAPTILPLSALLGKCKPELSSTILAAAWDGKGLVLGGDRDRLILAKAVAESASHWLLSGRLGMGENVEENANLGVPAQALVVLWTETLQFCLSTKPASTKNSPITLVHSALIDQLCTDLQRFHETLDGGTNVFSCLIDQEKFWSLSLTLGDCNLETTSMLLDRLGKLDGKHRLLPQMRKLFYDTLHQCQQSPERSPSQNEYMFFISLVKCVHPRRLFEENDDLLKKFVTNDLLRWMILHTSRLSHNEKSSVFVNNDFDILYHMLRDLPVRNELWNAIVRELIAAQCDLKCLTIGLDFLVTGYEGDSDWISCSNLSDFAIAQGEFVTHHDLSTSIFDTDDNNATASTHVDYDSYIAFFNVCVGFPLEDTLHDAKSFFGACDNVTLKAQLIRQDVLRKWIDSVLSQRHSKFSPLLEILLRMIWQTKDCQNDSITLIMSDEDRINIMIQAWKIDERSCRDYLHHLLKRDTSLQSNFFSSASKNLSRERSELLEVAGNPDELVSQWVSHAILLFDLTETAIARNASLVAQVRRGILLSVDDDCDPFDIWKSKEFSDYALAFLNKLHGPLQRISAMLGESLDLCCDPKVDTILRFLILTSDSFQLSDLSGTWKRQGTSEKLFALLVGDGGLDREFMYCAVDRLIVNLNDCLSEGEKRYEEILKMFSLLSMIIMSLFGPLFDSTELTPEDVVKGQMIYYITNPDDPTRRLPAIVKKVHYDSQTGHYFTISLVGQSEQNERQTVLERLRSDKRAIIEGREFPVLRKNSLKIERTKKRDLILSKVVKPFLTPSIESTSLQSFLSESMTLLGGYIGLGEEKGIGSPKYDIHRILASCHTNLQDALACDNRDSVIKLLWFASLGLGYGLNCKSIRWSHQCLQLTLLDSFEAFENKYKQWCPGNIKMDCAILGWLTTTIEHIIRESNPDFVVRPLTLLFRLASNILSTAVDKNLTEALSVGLLAIETGTKVMVHYLEMILDVSPVAMESFLMLVHSFCFEKKGAVYWNKTPSSILKEVRDICTTSNRLLEDFVPACNANYTYLLSALFDQDKRVLAFSLLKIAVEATIEPHKSEQSIPCDSTASRLEKWLVNLTQGRS